MNLINLKKITREDKCITGGKSSNLAELIQIGLNVPEGFVVPATIWELYSKTKNISDEIIDEIKKELVTFDSGMFAVRSSAIVEDGTTMAWAGQFSTFLNIKRNDVIEYIFKCFESTSNESAVAYGVENGVDVKKEKMAVLIQEMIESEVAGVLFTVNPVTKNEDEIIIESVQGLGTGVVDGTQTPDFFRIDKKTGIVLEKHSKNETLSKEMILQLISASNKIEKYFGCHQDVEWAFFEDELWILQSRPVTTV